MLQIYHSIKDGTLADVEPLDECLPAGSDEETTLLEGVLPPNAWDDVLKRRLIDRGLGSTSLLTTNLLYTLSISRLPCSDISSYCFSTRLATQLALAPSFIAMRPAKVDTWNLYSYALPHPDHSGLPEEPYGVLSSDRSVPRMGPTELKPRSPCLSMLSYGANCLHRMSIGCGCGRAAMDTRLACFHR